MSEECTVLDRMDAGWVHVLELSHHVPGLGVVEAAGGTGLSHPPRCRSL